MNPLHPGIRETKKERCTKCGNFKMPAGTQCVSPKIVRGGRQGAGHTRRERTVKKGDDYKGNRGITRNWYQRSGTKPFAPGDKGGKRREEFYPGVI